MKKLLLYTVLAAGFTGLMPLNAMDNGSESSFSDTSSSTSVPRTLLGSIHNGTCSGVSDGLNVFITGITNLAVNVISSYVNGKFSSPAIQEVSAPIMVQKHIEVVSRISEHYKMLCEERPSSLTEEEKEKCRVLKQNMFSMLEAATSLQLKAMTADLLKK